MKNIFVLPALFIIGTFFSCSTSLKDSNMQDDRSVSIDLGWKFFPDSIAGGESNEFNDSAWKDIDLPHDWSIDYKDTSAKEEIKGPFTKKSEGGPATGHVKGGTAWYRKHFVVSSGDSLKQINLCFDGVYMLAHVWVNGNEVGKHYYGYTPFSFDITKWLRWGKDNVIAVEVRNPGKNSRWYSGSGIYRHVWLTKTNPIHVNENGVFVTTPRAGKDTAVVQLMVDLCNESAGKSEITVRSTLTNPEGREIGKTETKEMMDVKQSIKLNQSLKIASPVLWSTESPVLYRALVQVYADDKLVDAYPVSFGIRDIKVSAKDGLTINGKNIELKGACMHHDNGLLGSATFDRAEERRVEIMKANGYNAIRTSHNPPSKQFLDACDRFGMLVIDEAFDMWEHPKNVNDYSVYFKEHWKADLESMILRDRNHPSVIIWSIGNEINERADTLGQRIAKQLSETVKSIDGTRTITAAICMFWDHPGWDWTASPPAFKYLDIGGYNYQWGEYNNDHQKFPERVMMGTESFPSDAFENWDLVEKSSWVIGDFVWTGMDYLGESGIGHVYLDKTNAGFTMPWPWYNAWCGDIDICGQKKPQSYYRDIIWNRSKIEMAVHTPVPDGKKEGISLWGWPDEQQSWTWPGAEGKTMEVSVYTRCSEVRLELNGKVIGVQKIETQPELKARSFADIMAGIPPKLQLKATFSVPYKEGELKAIALENGKEIASKVLKSVGKPAGIKLIPDRTNIKANRNDLAFVTIEIVDKDGNLVPNAAIPLKIAVEGVGELIASGNAAPNDMKSFRNPQCTTFQGRCLAIVRPFEKEGSIQVKVTAEGLGSQSAEIQTKAKE